MKKSTLLYPRLSVDTALVRTVGQAGGLLLTETVARSGLGASLAAGLSRWRKALAIHDPGKVVVDLALTLAPTPTPAKTALPGQVRRAG